MKVGLLFPGQGAQSVGMGRDLYENSKTAKAIFDEAASVLQDDFLKVVFEGPEEKLMTTAYSQPAILTVSVAALEALKASEGFKSFNSAFVAGLSLGEYSALVASGALSFKETLLLAQKRSQFMEEACQLQSGKMAAVIGLDQEKIIEICKSSGTEVANFNTPQQTVITGIADKVDTACVALKEAGAKNVVPLAVAGAFHSSLMQTAQDKFAATLEQISLAEATVPLISNVDAKPSCEPQEIRQKLACQITSSVQWVDTIAYMQSQGVTSFFEIGPGTVLKGLMRKIDRSLSCQSIQKLGDIESAVAPSAC